MMADDSVNTAEIVNILIATNCPLLVRSDDWWVEELLFKPGKSRTELLTWAISRSTNTFANNGYSDLESTTISVPNSLKTPDTEEGVLEVLSSAGICSDKDLSFVQGNMSPCQQLKHWNLLLKPLTFLEKSNINTSISFGCSALHSTVSMDNFLDAFTIKASLLPADVQSEIEQIDKKREEVSSEKAETYSHSLIYDDIFVQTFSEKIKALKLLKEQYVSVYNNDLKISIPKNPCTLELLNIDNEIDVINGKVEAWNEKITILQGLEKRNAESSRQMVETAMKQASKDQSFDPFRKMCDYRNAKD